MGTTSSSISELTGNYCLKRLVGSEHISQNDPFWNQLLSYSFQIPISSVGRVSVLLAVVTSSSSDTRLLEESTAILCKNFAINNFKTGNLGSLIRVWLARVGELKASAECQDNIFTWQTYNALFIIRNSIKYFIENLTEELIIQHFDAVPEGEAGKEVSHIGPVGEAFLNALAEVLVDVPVVSFTYALHLEALNCLIVLLSIQMFQPQKATGSELYRYLMQGKCSVQAYPLVRTLVSNYIKQERCPAELVKGNESWSLTAAVTYGLWSVMTLGLARKQKPEQEEFKETLLADQSLLFILILASHSTARELGLKNPYREALFSFTNSHEHQETIGSNQVDSQTFKVDFTKLYDCLSLTLKDDQTTLLLYLLLHRNINVKSFILSRTNVDTLVVPLLKILYHAEDKNSHHIYMALIILLILSEDDAFGKAVHELMLTDVLWFKERIISTVSLGGLLVLVLIRTIQCNITRMRDKYLHTNCLAALANMSAQFNSLGPYVTQRIVSLFASLSRKHTKIVERLKNSALKNHDRESSPDVDQEDFAQDLAVLEEVIRMVLEVINSCLTSALHVNPNLVYTLIYQRQVFDHFRTHPTFQDIIQNIDTVLAYFTTKLKDHDKNLSVQEVLDVITQGAKQFKKERLKKFPELKFKYVEEDQPEEFFIPYVWSLVYHSSNLYFNQSRIQLFSLTTTKR